MADMDDKFQEILGNEEAMSQIMSIAQSFSSGSSGVETTTAGENSGDNVGNIGSLLAGLDPSTLAIGMRLFSAYQKEHRSVELMTALRPFVSEERQDMIDRITKASKYAKVASSLLVLWKEREGGDV